ncbi:MAG: type II toxin-antitoxin system VapC family toxin [Rhizobium giardinii]
MLLDTHVAIGRLTETRKLPAELLAMIASRDNEVFVSAASICEIAIKFPLRRAGAPPFDGYAARYLKTVGYSFLDISVEHAAANGHLKTVHADPFDRLLIAQAVTEPLTLITRDSKVAGYSPTFITW